MPKVSVIIPIYNTEEYLKECLDSVISQTLTDIEIICIDDGSTDSSFEILKEYAQKDDRFVLLRQKNKGAGPARNKGIKTANGEFIAFMDSDDKYPETNTLEVMFVKAKENNVLICGGEFSDFTNDDSSLNINYDSSLEGFVYEQEGIINYSEYQFDYGYTRFLYNKMFLLENNLFFPNYRRFQDPPFFVKAMIKAEKFYAIKKITYANRIFHKNVCWNKRNVQHLLLGLLHNYKFAEKYNFEALKRTTTARFWEHLPKIKTDFDFKALMILSQISKYDLDIKNYCKNEKLTIKKHYISPFLRYIFSLKNSDDKRYKIISIFGVKFWIWRKNARL